MLIGEILHRQRRIRTLSSLFILKVWIVVFDGRLSSNSPELAAIPALIVKLRY